jgi:hypothetical protein
MTIKNNSIPVYEYIATIYVVCDYGRGVWIGIWIY